VEHLFLGKPRDNIRDAMQKGRMAVQQGRGPNRTRSGRLRTLNEWQVVGVMARWLQRTSTQVQIGKEFGIENAQVGRIASGKAHAIAFAEEEEKGFAMDDPGCE